MKKLINRIRRFFRKLFKMSLPQNILDNLSQQLKQNVFKSPVYINVTVSQENPFKKREEVEKVTGVISTKEDGEINFSLIVINVNNIPKLKLRYLNSKIDFDSDEYENLIIENNKNLRDSELDLLKIFGY